MTTLVKIIVATIVSLSLFSCNFNYGVKGNGHVTVENRPINKPFTAINASEGLDVYLTQSDDASISVEADDNLQELIITEVIDNVLKIHTKENIGSCTSKKIIVSFKDVTSITATSGSDVKSTNTFIIKDLNLETTSGSDMNLDVNTVSLNCKSTSGSDLILSGKTIKLIAEATSGSAIEAADLIAESSQVTATSGADITVNTSKELTANATSGADIKYLGNPEVVNKSDSSSGSIKKQ
ncbi:putative autotransporter adhesin-like protein [Mariniflexile fucanivorans]|uniref:Putative autotransporter adhesin-like protein n=1 Tax=Mariniflexile fucanivorans TaxID=264023 RepID=A0A4R1RL37_9FLAO|nr:head GIN domain-containing protein [Mariniflexile fucanivorans]TCL66796.1 putative autotransporter adhesin-like protein [Mariniflexile fucanivorans]